MTEKTTDKVSKMNVYKAISAVQQEIAKIGISKDRINQMQRYQFRGIDDVFNALSPILAKHKLVILPKVIDKETTERTTAKGGLLIYVIVKVDYYFISAEDDSTFVVTAYGEAMDSGDKATIKAMSAAYKTAALQAFCIPTEGDNDADSTSYDVSPKKPELTPDKTKPWQNAINAYKRDGNLDAVKARMEISAENEKLLIEQADVA